MTPRADAVATVQPVWGRSWGIVVVVGVGVAVVVDVVVTTVFDEWLKTTPAPTPTSARTDADTMPSILIAGFRMLF
jgi:hypothetical protein